MVDSFETTAIFYEIPQYEHNSYITRKYTFETADEEHFRKLIEFLENHSFDVFSKYYIYPKNIEEIEKELIVDAVNNAKNSAIQLVTKSDIKLGEIVEVDDRNIEKYPEKGFAFHSDFKTKLFDKLTFPKLNTNKYSLVSEKDLGYYVWITFSID